MRRQLRKVLAQVRDNHPAELTIPVGDTSFTRVFRPGERLILLGAGHVARPLCRYAADLGFQVTVVDDRPDFACRSRFPEAAAVRCGDFVEEIRDLCVGPQDYVVVITRGHRFDDVCLRELLSGFLPRYLGMMGSRRRVAALFQQLEEDGFPRPLLDRIHAPIGESIGALTVEEIGISIVAQLIRTRRADRRRPEPGETRLLLETPELDTLRFLTRPGSRALLLVLEATGSAPIRSGALMGVDGAMGTAGTIGGGCAEGQALREAFRLLGTGEQRVLTVELNNNLAAEEGMVCGGQMKILLKDLP